MKITCFELEESFIDLDDVLLNEVEIMSETETANNALVELGSLQGTAADTLKDYFNTIHAPIISGLMGACADLDLKLKALFEDYHVAVDSKRSSVLCDVYIGEKKEKIGTIQGDLDSVTAELHTILAGVSDIFSTSASYATYESEISANVVTVQSDMQQVITDLETFNTNHLLDCETISSALDDIIRVIDLAQSIFVDNQISSVTDEELLTALSSLDVKITDMTMEIMEDPSAIASVLEIMDKTLTVYGMVEMLAVLGISASDYRKLVKQGLKLSLVKSNGNVMLKIVGDGVSTDVVKDSLKSMNIPHMTSDNINKLVGSGLMVLDKKKVVKSPHLLAALTNKDGFKSVAKIVITGEMPPLFKWKGYGKLVDGLGWAIDGGANIFDNCYDENSGGWIVNGETVGDTVTDTVVDIGLDIGIETLFTVAGSFIPVPVVGTVVGYVTGTLVSAAVSSFEWPGTEPPKTPADMIKDSVSDLTHSVTDTLSNIFW